MFKKAIPVEVIHAEFDSAETRCLERCDEILSKQANIEETPLERKAKIMESLGFKNSETVVKAKELEAQKNILQSKLAITNIQAKTIRKLKQKYPLEKFLTVDELDRICNKYNLIHAPAANYIKDIPEKNILEMKNVKPLEDEDKDEISMRLIKLETDYLLSRFNKEEPIFTLLDLKRINYNYSHLKKWFLSGSTTWAYCAVQHGVDGNEGREADFSMYWFKKSERIDKSGIFIAAPKSHFDLKGLTKKSKFGFFNVTIQENKDPISFEYCKNDIVRILSKWGDENDQAYLDSALTNEIQN